ncbi:microfibril-associated glycoprotein 4-like [Argopecten irradians]|uniref:microfibril-associated glycoprotein 4-like n=1 Tax=Argopecten irradians TaxID=31199 RepID=UPI003720AFD8
MSCALRCHQASCAAFVVDGNDRMCKFVLASSNPYSNLYKSGYIRLCHSLPTGTPSGVYAITPNNMFITYTDVYCDMDTLGSGWTVIQQRFNDSQDFDKNWEDYKQGFGSPYGEYWIGNENMYLLTSSDSYELRIEMEDDSGVSKYAAHSTFSIASKN